MRSLREESEKIRFDYILIATILLLTLLGLVILNSASYLFSLNQPGRFGSWLTRLFPRLSIGWYPLGSNIFVCVCMLLLFPVLSLIDLAWLKNKKMLFLILTVTGLLNVLPIILPGNAGVEARRWIWIGGHSFQPSELIKVALPLYLAYSLDKNNDRLKFFTYGPLPTALVTCAFCFLVFVQSNLSDVILILVSSMIICFAAGIRIGWFALALAIIIPLGVGVIRSDKDGRWSQRIESFLHKDADPLGADFQVSQSVKAIHSGGFWGKGIGQGTLKTGVPEVHGDFVFASFVEETGFVGVVFYTALLGVFAFISYHVARRCKNRYNQLLAFGLVTPIVLQTLVNMAVVSDLTISTGIPLPFISSGGSSLLVTLISAALLVNISRRYVREDREE